MYFIQLCSLL